MINFLPERDLFLEQEKDFYREGNLLILASKEYVSRHFNLDLKENSPEDIAEEQKNLTQSLFLEIRKNPKRKDTYPALSGRNNLSIIILTETDEGYANVLDYVRDLLEPEERSDRI